MHPKLMLESCESGTPCFLPLFLGCLSQFMIRCPLQIGKETFMAKILNATSMFFL